ncbi:MAG: Mov34/MPN/PAD-1 family protein [Candidatus Gracilibacteria bacterium]|jgi:integrative and conjugative element protein (TIGR02256 family)
MNDLSYSLPNGLGRVVFTANVVEKLHSYKQTRFFSKESGGQLFASFEDDIIRVFEITGPRKFDKRSKFSFFPHRKTEQIEIHNKYIKEHIHFVGDWHTHPEKTPKPSNCDQESVAKIMEESRHSLQGIFLVIVGTVDFPDCLYVGYQTKTELYTLGFLS